MEQINRNIIIHNDYRDLRLQRCFREYFSEIGEPLKENTRVFGKMQAAVTDCGMQCLVLQQEDEIRGFLQFQEEVLTHPMGFFRERLGFIRELWVAPELRRSGCGKAFVTAMEQYCRDRGIKKLILTYEENALGFYKSLGFAEDPSYSAENEQGVMVKLLA